MEEDEQMAKKYIAQIEAIPEEPSENDVARVIRKKKKKKRVKVEGYVPRSKGSRSSLPLIFDPASGKFVAQDE